MTNCFVVVFSRTGDGVIRRHGNIDCAAPCATASNMARWMLRY